LLLAVQELQMGRTGDDRVSLRFEALIGKAWSIPLWISMPISHVATQKARHLAMPGFGLTVVRQFSA
jgi:hypothetical protein